MYGEALKQQLYEPAVPRYMLIEELWPKLREILLQSSLISRVIASLNTTDVSEPKQRLWRSNNSGDFALRTTLH
jgi:hypothetical protein